MASKTHKTTILSNVIKTFFFNFTVSIYFIVLDLSAYILGDWEFNQLFLVYLIYIYIRDTG